VSLDEQAFELLNRCECCRKEINEHASAVVICKFPDGGADTLCVECYRASMHAAVAWYSFDGHLPKESTERRLQRARAIATRQRARTILEGTIYRN
jgi:hypothetical protein